jgi:hypothetical protein
VHKARGEPDLALSCFVQAQAVLSETAPRSQSAARVSSNIGEVWLARGGLGRALSFCQQGLDMREPEHPLT